MYAYPFGTDPPAGYEGAPHALPPPSDDGRSTVGDPDVQFLGQQSALVTVPGRLLYATASFAIVLLYPGC